MIISSCSNDEFAVTKQKVTYKTTPTKYSSSAICADFSITKPKVDFLFLWDNSSSQFFVNENTKTALKNMIESISLRFNYHIYMAPLIGTGDSNTYLIVENIKELTDSAALSKIIPQSSASSVLGSFPSASGSLETGFDRSIKLLTNNVDNGIFRKKAYTMVVLMSNGDDIKRTTSGKVDYPLTNTYITTKKNALINIRNNILDSLQFRFMTLVAMSSSDKCAGFMTNYAYKKMSQAIYFAPYTNGMSSPSDQAGSLWPDSYDICGLDFIHMFDGINNSIQDIIEKHKYNYWPVAHSNTSIDTTKIKAIKSTGETLVMDDLTNGFKYIGNTTRDTRYDPSSGEPFTGHLIQLFGDAIVTYPECLFVTTQAPADYYGYIQLHSQPVTTTIQLTINNKVIPKSTSNGWEYIGYKQSQNLKITGPNNYAPGTPTDDKTGYFLKLNGDAIYTNGASINLTYDPAAG